MYFTDGFTRSRVKVSRTCSVKNRSEICFILLSVAFRNSVEANLGTWLTDPRPIKSSVCISISLTAGNLSLNLQISG